MASPLTVLAAGAFVALAGPAHASTPQERSLADLVEAARSGSLPEHRELVGALVLAGEDASRAFLLELDRIAEGGDPESGLLDPADRPALVALRDRLAALPREIAGALEATPRLHPRHAELTTAALVVTERLGGARDLDAVAPLAGPQPPTGPTRVPARVAGFRRAAFEVLAREDAAFHAATETYATAPDALCVPLVDAIASHPTSLALEALVDCVGRRPEHDGVVLNRVQGLAGRVPSRLDFTELARVRDRLGADDGFVRCQAAFATGHLDDLEAVSPLIELLEDEDPSVRQAAHWSLQRLTATAMGPNRSRWRLWFEEQSSWWADVGAQRLEELASRDLAVLVPALNDLALRRLHKREIGPRLADLLHSEDPRILELGCAAAASLRAVEPLLRMADLLDHPREDVRRKAHASLRTATGLDLPTDRRLWRARLTR